MVSVHGVREGNAKGEPMSYAQMRWDMDYDEQSDRTGECTYTHRWTYMSSLLTSRE